MGKHDKENENNMPKTEESMDIKAEEIFSDQEKPQKKKRQKKEKTERKHSAMWKKNKKTLRNGSYSVLISVVVIAVVVMLNMIVNQIPAKYTKFDISTGKLYTIGEETTDVLNNLNEDVTIYYVVQKGNEDSNIEKLLEQYKENSKHVKVVKKDPVVYPNFVTKYSEDNLAENSLIVECGDRFKIVAYSNIYETTVDYSTYQQSVSGFDGEGQITGAISYVTSTSLPTVYYVEGHNEISIPSSLKDRIEKANVQLEALSLLTADTVPEDAAGLLMNSPATDYSKEEAEKVMKYLAGGGHAMILTDYTGKDMPNYQSILAAYGVDITDGVVVEQDKNRYVQVPYYLVPNIGASNVSSDMTGGSQYVLMSGCQGFSVSEDVRDTLDISQVLTTSDDAYVKVDPENMKTYDKEDGDVDGPFNVAVTISENVSTKSENSDDSSDSENTDESTETADDADTETSQTKETRIVSFASSSIMDETFNSTVSDGNYTLYINSLKWIMDTNETSTVSIASKSMETQYLTVTAAKGAFFAVLLCFVLPIACLIIGGVICFQRKRR